MSDALARLQARWRQILPSAHGPPDALAELVAAYAAPSHHYHDLDHVAALLALSTGHAARLVDRDAVDLAIFYHDSVHDPRRSDNEARSAALAQERASVLCRNACEVGAIRRPTAA